MTIILICGVINIYLFFIIVGVVGYNIPYILSLSLSLKEHPDLSGTVSEILKQRKT